MLLAAVAAGTTVLVPNSELGTALLDAIEREYRAAGREIWSTPRVRDFNGWLRELYAQWQLTDATSPRCLSDVEERELWRAVIDDGALGRDFLDPAAAARAARHARRTVQEYAIPLRSLVLEPSEETQAFLQWNRSFEDKCRLLGVISADGLLGIVQPPPQPITWIESPVWRPAARAWLQRFGAPLQPQVAVGTSSVYKAAAPEAEIAAVAEWALANLRSTPEFRAWVCVPDLSQRRAKVADAFDAVLMPQRFVLREVQSAAPYALAGGTALADFAPVRAALEILAASAGMVSFPCFSALLRAPELQASANDAGAAAQLDVALRDHAPSDADLGHWLQVADHVALTEEISPVAALQRLHTVRRELAQLHGAHPLSVWIPIWIAALEAGPWALRGRWSSIEFQAAERFRELLGALATADAILGSHSREAAQRVLLRAARDTTFQAQTGVPSIWVSSQYLDPWLNYGGLWICGCSDQAWPAPVDPVALLPVRLQRDFGVAAASAESQMASALDLQRRWQGRATRCVFSSSDPGDGRSNSLSPLLPKEATPLSFTGDLPPVRPHWRAMFESAPLLERFTDEWAPPFAPPERTHGVATLKAQSRCAFRGFAESRLSVPQLQTPVPGFNEGERGELVHHSLERIWSQLRTSSALLSLSAESEQALLDTAIQQSLTLVCRRRDPGARWRERERVRLRGLLGKWLQVERGRVPFVVQHIEQPAQTVQLAGLDFRVRIDREDVLLDGARILIDYKTGAAPRDWGGNRPDNPQLPIYALLRPDALVAVAYGKVNAVGPEFVAESQRRDLFKPGGHSSSLEGMPNFATLVELWRTRMETLAANFAAGHAAVAPTLKACRTCHLPGLCRVPAALEEVEELPVVEQS